MSEQATATDQVTEDQYLGMSDEEFSALDLNTIEAGDSSEESVTDTDGASDDDDKDDLGMVDDSGTGEDAAASAEADESGDSEDKEEEDGEADTATTESDDTEEATDDTDPAKESDDADAEDPDKVEDAEKEADKAELDYKAEYEKLLAPFRANGKDMTVDSIDDARQLMQMGANYNKKMAALKPSLKTLKLLENNDLLGDEKLSFLIDLHKGDKGAIQKLIKDSGIDPLDMDVQAESDYEPKTYTVDEREMALDEVLEKIQDTPTYSETVNVVSNKWDKASKQAVANQPGILEAINDHMASGIYERVNAEVEKQRTLGRLNGLTDLEAYQQVGDTLHERGAFNDLVQKNQDTPPAEKQKVAPKPKGKSADPKLKEKKRAASSTNAKPAATAPDLNPLGMSDEEFEKQYNADLL